MSEQNDVYIELVKNPQNAEEIMKRAVSNGAGWIQHGAVFRDVSGNSVKCNISEDGEYWFTYEKGGYFRGRLKPIKFLRFDEYPVGVKR